MREIAPGTRTVLKKKRYFIHNNHYFSLVDVNGGQCQLLEVSVDENILSSLKGDYTKILPQFISNCPFIKNIDVIKPEDKSKYSDHSLAILKKE